MNTCKTCKHWRPDHCEYGHVAGWGKCRTAFDLNDAEEGPPPPNGSFGAQDLEGYAAAVNTGPDFGCVIWTEKSGD